MRLNNDIKDYLKEAITEKIPGAIVYLIGSRINDQAGGKNDMVMW